MHEIFSVRAHHLPIIFEVARLSRNYEPEEALKHAIFYILSGIQQTLADDLSVHFMSSTDYHHDLMGTNKSTQTMYALNLFRVFERFISLEPSSPIQIITTSDAICGACHIGNHCKTTVIEKEMEVFGRFYPNQTMPFITTKLELLTHI